MLKKYVIELIFRQAKFSIFTLVTHISTPPTSTTPCRGAPREPRSVKVWGNKNRPWHVTCGPGSSLQAEEDQITRGHFWL